MILIGERLNSSRKSVLQAFERQDRNYLIDQAVRQARAGAAYIDLNAAALLDGEAEALRWAIPLLQENLSIPLSLDTPNPEAMEAALEAHRGRPLLNSLTGETRCLNALLPLIRKFRPRVVALCLDERGPAETVERALDIAERLLALLTAEKIAAEDIFIDPLIRPVGVDWRSGRNFLETVERLKANLPGTQTIAGLSNVSFGLPRRKLLNRTFLILALQKGLDAAICDPLDADLQAGLRAALALVGQDPSLRDYLRFLREKAKADPEEQ
jgi:5-methyltetrahydrofolate--homocysteine methyltransferase